MAADSSKTDEKQVHRAVSEMTLGELKEFVSKHGSQIGVEVTRTETVNTKYAALPRVEVISTEGKKNA